MEQLKQLLTAAGIAYKENEPLAAHCTFKIGGPARLFVQPADRPRAHPLSDLRQRLYRHGLFVQWHGHRPAKGI